MEEYRDRDESLIERQKLVEDGGDEEELVNISSAQSKSIQTPISPVLSNKIFSENSKSSFGKTPSENTKLNFVNERKSQEKIEYNPKKKIQRDDFPQTHISPSLSNLIDLKASPVDDDEDHKVIQEQARPVTPPQIPSSSKAASPINPSILSRINSNLIKSNSKSSLDSFANRPLKHHSFQTDLPDVRSMERALLGLLGEFHSGQLRAFGSGCMDQMRNIRSQQEQLAKLHYDLGANVSNDNKKSQENMQLLTQKLEQLSFSLSQLSNSTNPMNNEI